MGAGTDMSAAVAAAVLGQQGVGQHPADPNVLAALAAQGMTGGEAFSPGRPLDQYFPQDSPPRKYDYETGHNIGTRPRSKGGRPSFRTLADVIDNYDFARLCIEHRADDIRSLDWDIVPMKGLEEDVSAAVKKGRTFYEMPDGVTPFDSWQQMFLEDLLRYDAGAIQRQRNRKGDVMELHVVSGTTIAPLIDYYGRVPKAPAPAFVQFTNGVPAVWLTADDLIYQPFRAMPESEYGKPPIEYLLLNANTDLRFQWHFLQYFTEGTLPDHFMEAPPDMSDPAQIEVLQKAWDALMEGDQSQKHKVKWIPAGSNPRAVKDTTFDATFPLHLMRKTAAAYKVTPNDLGFTDAVNKASADTQMDVQFRKGTLPLVRHLQGIYTRVLQRDLGLPVEFHFDVGGEKEDREQEARVMDYYVRMGALSPDEARSNVLSLPIDKTRPTPRFIVDRQGIVPLIQIHAQAGVVDPETGAPDPATIDQAIADAADAAELAAEAPLSETVSDAETKGAATDGTGDADGGTETEPSETEVRKELARWRDNTRSRIRKGLRPKRFSSEVLPEDLVRALSTKLEKATDVQQVDALFADEVRKARPFAEARRLRASVTDHYGPLLGAAMTFGLDSVTIAAAWFDRPAGHAMDPVLKAVAPIPDEAIDPTANAYTSGLQLNTADLQVALALLYADGYLVGGHLAALQLEGVGITAHASIATSIEWGAWTPGNPAAAGQLVAPGLTQLLADAHIVIKDLGQVTLDRLGDALAEGVRAGDSRDQLARRLAAIIDDPERARLIAGTEYSRAVGAATLASYRESGVSGKSWMGGDCPICEANAGEGPIPVNSEFPSGDPFPPAHPHCTCSLAPEVIEGLTTDDPSDLLSDE
jgi:Phage portal protein